MALIAPLIVDILATTGSPSARNGCPAPHNLLVTQPLLVPLSPVCSSAQLFKGRHTQAQVLAVSHSVQPVEVEKVNY